MLLEQAAEEGTSKTMLLINVPLLISPGFVQRILVPRLKHPGDDREELNINPEDEIAGIGFVVKMFDAGFGPKLFISIV